MSRLANRSLSLIGAAALLAMLTSATAARAALPNKCSAAKEKCVALRTKALLSCHVKAEASGAPVDFGCIQKANDKFAACFTKAEAAPPCFTIGDAAIQTAKVDAFVGDIVQTLDPGYPVPVQSKCSAAKKKCVAAKAAALLGCYSKAERKGTAVDPLCLSKAQGKFVACFTKAQGAGDCLDSVTTATVEAKVDTFALDVKSGLEPACGNNIAEIPFEDCDGTSDTACPGGCRPPGDLNECRCPVCGDNDINQPGEECDRSDSAACPGHCAIDCTCAVCGNDIAEPNVENCDGTDAPACVGMCLSPGDPHECHCPVCGDNDVNQPGEQCDGPDDAACPGKCLPTCTCAVCGNNLAQPPIEICDGTDDAACPGACFPPADPHECECPSLFQCVSTNNCGCTTLTLDTPACVMADDVMVAHVSHRPNTGDTGITAPAGWTQVFEEENPGAQLSANVFYKVATASEPASYDFAQTSNGSDMAGAIVVYRGLDPADPLVDAGGQPTSGTSHGTPCIAAPAGTTVVGLFSLNNCSTCDLNDTAWTPPLGMKERYDVGAEQSSRTNSEGSDATVPSSGCLQKSATSFTSEAGFGVALTLRPSGAPDPHTLVRGFDTQFDVFSSLTLQRPAAIKENDVLLVHLSVGYAAGPDATPPPGWTLIRYDSDGFYIGSWLYYRVAGPAEPSSYAFAVSSGFNLIGAITDYAGINPASPIQASDGVVTTGAAQATPSISTTTNDAAVVTFYSIWEQVSYTPPANTRVRYEVSGAQNHWKTIMAADFILAAAGPTGAQTATSAYPGTGLAQIVALERLVPTPALGGCCGFQ